MHNVPKWFAKTLSFVPQYFKMYCKKKDENHTFQIDSRNK